MFGEGLIKGIKVTLGHLFEKSITQQYPEQRPQLSTRSRCSFELESQKCTSCGICAMSCPNKVISIDFDKDQNNKRQLRKYEMELGYCLFCGLCVESCPFNALKNTQNFELSAYSREKTKLTLFKNQEGEA
jgi:NADH-quinone oxidoreductase subunit I